MVIDTSALIAILLKETEAEKFAKATLLFSFPLARVGMQSRRASVAACKKWTLARGNQNKIKLTWSSNENH